MEGIPVWFFFAFFAIYGLMGLCLVPALAALGFLLAGRPRQVLKLFATALLCEAMVWAAFCFLLLLIPTGLSLVLAGAGQFVAALRSPRTYAAALGFAAAAVAVIVAGTPMMWGVLVRLGLPPDWVNLLPEWHSLPAAVISLSLGATSMMIAVLPLFVSRQEETPRAIR